PPTVLVSLRRSARTTGAIRGSGAFAVSLLRSEQRDVAVAFASGSDASRDAAIVDLHGVAVVREALSYCFCRVADIFEVEDHALVIGTVLGTSSPGGRPLLRVNGDYAAGISGVSDL